MSPTDVRDVFAVRPFSPVVLHLADGSSHRIDNPNDVLVAGGMVYVGVRPDEDGAPTRAIHINLRRITRIEPAVPDAA